MTNFSLRRHTRQLCSVARKGCAAAFILSTSTTASHGAFLFDGFLDPTSTLATDYSAWNNLFDSGRRFYATNGAANYPTSAAPFGSYTSASAAGVAYPGPSGVYNPADRLWVSANPFAFWDSRNATITQTGAPAFIASSGIYSFSGATTFRLNNTTSYNLGTVIFQFQTLGTQADYSSIQLRYTDGTGTHTLSAHEMIREYSGSSSSFGGLDTRAALQWNLTGLNIKTYEIVLTASGSSMSFAQALLDTSATYATIVPGSGKFTGSSGNWSNTSLWTQNTTNLNYVPQENGNATFSNASAAIITVDTNRTVGNILFDTAANTTINASGGSTLTANTGIETTSQATGVYTVNAPFSLNALNVMDVKGGKVVMNGVISSTGAYGISKSGEGTLELNAANTFSGGLGLNGGTLRLAAANSYAGDTAIGVGTLIVAAHAGSTGALGNSTSPISLGSDSGLLSGNLTAALLIEGNHTIDRAIALAPGTFQKTLGAFSASSGATFANLVAFGTSTSVRFHAAASTDKLNFTGGMNGGANTVEIPGTVLIDGPGTVSFGGAGKTYSYANNTNITAGTLKIDSGATFDSAGNVTVGAGSQLIVQGTLSGAGALHVNGGTIGGSGTIHRAITLDAGDVLSPGNSPGTLNTVSQTWGSAAKLKLEINDSDAGAGIGWDKVAITGTLSLTANPTSKFKLELTSLTGANEAGQIADFDYNISRTWLFLTATDEITGFDANAFEIDLSHFQNSLNGASSVFTVAMGGDGKSLELHYTAVPEPSSSMLALCGAFVFLNRRKRMPIAR